VVGLLLLSVLSQEPARATVHVITTPPGAVISIDGVLRGLAPRDEQLEAGIHSLTVEQRGARTEVQTFAVVAGEERTLRIELVAEHWPRRPFPVAGVVTASSGVLVLTLGLLLRFPAEAAARQITAVFQRGGGWDDQARTIEAQGLSAQTWSWFFTGLGAALTASGALVTLVKVRAPSPPLPQLTISPMPGGAFASWSVTW
jgi:PEGA domain